MGDHTTVMPGTETAQRFHRPARRVPVRLTPTNHGARYQARDLEPERPTVRQRIAWWLGMHRDLQDAIGRWAVRLALLIILASVVASFVDAWDKEQLVTVDSSGEVEVAR